jgi:basic membrane lipoprotein Med (substrate-binding protein (PBP1-ABC) superfamily)
MALLLPIGLRTATLENSDHGGSTLSSSRSGTLASIVIVVIVFGSVGGILFLTNQYDPSSIAVVAMNPGFGDMARADQVREGLTENILVQYYFPDPPDTEAEAEALMESLAASGDYLLIIIVGHELQDELQRAADKYPNQKFAMIGGLVNLDNVASATFDIQEAAFLAGIIAALIADDDPYNGTIGILASVPDDYDVIRMIAGFEQGVDTAIQDYGLNVEVLTPRYVGSYNDSATAETMTSTLFITDFCSIIFAPVRASIVGVRAGMLAANDTFYDLSLTNRMPLVIGAEMNLDYYGNRNPLVRSGPSWIVTSVVPRYDTSVINIVNATLWNMFPGGITENYNLANQGVNITDFEFSTTIVDDSYIDAAWEYAARIINGTIMVNDS